jgi:signal transduction histidine kinase
MMRLLRPASVRHKLLAVVLLTTLTALVVAIAAMMAYDLRGYRQRLVADMTTQADLLGKTTVAALTFDDPRVAQENLELLRYRPRIRAAAIYNARGQLFARFALDDGEDFPRLPEGDGTRFAGDDFVLFKRVVNDREIVGTVYLRAEYQFYDRLLGYLGIAAIVTAIAMLVAYLLSRQLQRIVTSPLLAIAEVAREVTEQRRFSMRAPKLSEDEVGTLAASFNTMLAEIERATRDLQASNADLAREIAERSRAEQEVLRLNADLEKRVKERTAQLEFTNAELEAFCYSVSHDLRAPLRAIDGFSQALLQDFPKEVPEEGQRYLSRIRASTQRMGQLIEDLLNLSRVSRGILERRDIDLSELARQVVSDLQQHDPQRRSDVSIWEGMRANGDVRLLRAALENLIGNAWKFTSKAERPRIEIGALADNGRKVFYVRDNGAGFDMAYANKLFGAFQRLHSATEYAGTGIGLATVQRIVHRHGGRVWADAQPGKGAVFFFTLEPGGTEGTGHYISRGEVDGREDDFARRRQSG